MRLLVALLVLLSGTPVHGDSCSDPEYRQFDFWIGQWRVETPQGKVAGTNDITRSYDGCVIEERWSGAAGMRGASVNIWDKSRRVWHQTWVDSNGLLLELEGGLQDGKMVLSGKRTTAQGELIERITWSPLENDRVRQLWESSRDGGKSWQTVFTGMYIRR